MRAATAQKRLCDCAGYLEHLMYAYPVNTKIKLSRLLGEHSCSRLMRGSRKFCQGGPVFFVVVFSHSVVRTFIEKQSGSIASRGSEPEFLRKPIAICDFPGGGGCGTPASHPPPTLYGSAYVLEQDTLSSSLSDDSTQENFFT